MVLRDKIDQTARQWETSGLDVDAKAIQTGLYLNALAELGKTGLAAVFEQQGLTVGDFDVLAALLLAPDNELSPSEIARAGMLSPAGTTHRLDRLEKLGYVERHHGTEDRRSVRVVLTDAGRVKVEAAAILHSGLESTVFSSLTQKDHTNLNRILAKLVDVVEGILDD